MGIRGLNTFIKKVCPECIITNHISVYSGKTFAIDASILLYKYRHISNIDTSCNHSHIIGFFNRIKYYKNNNIIPIFVFDGIPPEQKKITLKKRQAVKKKIYEKIEILQDINSNTLQSDYEKEEIEKEINKLSCQIINVTKTHINEVKKLLDIINVKYYDAPDEAEKYCVYLQKCNIVDYIVTDDTDVFTFGGKNILKCSVKNNLTEIKIDEFLQKINYDMKKFIDFCILSGCDYLPYVPSLAINTVYSHFKKKNTIEEIIEINKYSFPEEYTNGDLNKVRRIFDTFNYEFPSTNNNFNYNYEPTENQLNKEFLLSFLENLNLSNSNNSNNF